MPTHSALTFAAGDARIELTRADITQQTTDAIVNAANSSLMGGGGVDGAIHRAGGPAILAECRAIRDRRGPLPPGEAVITTGGRLSARHVIHTVGPVWRGGGAGEAETLARCYRASLRLAAEAGLESVSFPSISTGAFGYPVDDAARVALAAVHETLTAGCAPVSCARWVLFSESDLAAYRAALEDLMRRHLPE
jgi:O-acetyl-ADP-ribose deacetylase (regulator of RNase III)